LSGIRYVVNAEICI